MILPPEPIDPKKNLFEEIVRYTREHRRYLKACEPGGANEHGPWLRHEPEGERITRLIAPLKPYDDFTSEHYWNDRRWYNDSNNHDW